MCTLCLFVSGIGVGGYSSHSVIVLIQRVCLNLSVPTKSWEPFFLFLHCAQNLNIDHSWNFLLLLKLILWNLIHLSTTLWSRIITYAFWRKKIPLRPLWRKNGQTFTCRAQISDNYNTSVNFYNIKLHCRTFLTT